MLKINNIVKSFPQITNPVLDKVNLNINEGDYCIILGTNGSGKSTLFKIISGEYEANSGKILLNNKDITNLAAHQKANYIASVTQDINKGTVAEMSILENFSLSLMRNKKSSLKFYCNNNKTIIEKIKMLDLGLEKFTNNKISSLSGGQRQAIATLMALFPIPEILLLDEHTSALDPHTSKKVMNFTDKYIRQNKITTLMITHNLSDALAYGNRLIIMHHGKIVKDFDQSEKNKLSEHDILDLFSKMGDLL